MTTHAHRLHAPAPLAPISQEAAEITKNFQSRARRPTPKPLRISITSAVKKLLTAGRKTGLTAGDAGER